MIYISPANDDDSQLIRTNGNRFNDEIILRHYLFDPSYHGFFYRTDTSLIEQWQLWDDDDDLNKSRPRPPASPFGLHEGLYHDDTTNEIQRYLRHMDDEDKSCSCTSSITSNQTSTSTVSSISTKYSRRPNRYSSNKSKPIDDTDQFNLSLSNLEKSSFEPIQSEKKSKTKKKRPIIIEKVVPNPFSTIPILNPKLTPPSIDRLQESQVDCNDVIQMNPKQSSIDLPSYKSSSTHAHSYQHRTSNKIPIIDMRSIERLFNEENSKNQRRLSLNVDNQSQIKTTPDPIDKKQRKPSVISSTHSSKNESHRNHSTITAGPAINYVERPFVSSLPQNQIISPIPPVLTDAKLNEYISNIYGTTRSIKSNSSSATNQGSKSNTSVVNPTYMSTFRYMQSSMNRNLLEEYRNAY